MRMKTQKWIAVAALIALVGCGNDPSARRGTDALKDLAKIMAAGLKKSDQPEVTAPDPLAMIDNTLARLPGHALQFVLQEKTGAFAIASVYGTNGSHVTWVTPNKRTMTLDRGMLVATRGLTADLMSVEDGGAAHLVSSRQSGTVVKGYRYLTSSEEIALLELTCAIERGAPAQVNSGEISTQTILMTENCRTSAGHKITNSYWVDDAGRVIQSVQWINGTAGKIVFRKLRH